MKYKPLHIESNKNQHARGAEKGPQEQVTTGQGGSKSLRRIEKQDWIDSERLRTNHSTPRQRLVPQLVINKMICSRFKLLALF